MVKKIRFIILFIAALVLSGLLFSRVQADWFIESSAQLEQAKNYEDVGDYEQAEATYKQIVTSNPGSNEALAAQERLTMLYFTWDKQSQAEAAFQKLVSDFSKNEHIAQAVHETAAHCDGLTKYQNARDYHQYVLDHWPGDAVAIWSQTGVAISNIGLGEDTAAETAIGKLLSDFSGHQYIDRAVYDIAERYQWFKRHEKAKEFCQYIVDHWPQAEFAIWSQMSVATSHIVLGDQQAAQTATEKLVADFNDHPDLGWAIYIVGERYYYEGNFSKAAAIWEETMNEAPEFNFTKFAHAYNFMAMADCYHQLGQYQKAIEYYQKVVDDYPDYEYVWNALFLVGRNYQSLKKTGGISESQANSKTKSAYQQLLGQYPDCKAAKAAQRWLSRHN